MSTYYQYMENKVLGVQFGNYAVTDEDVGLIVRYVGSEDSATVTVADSATVTVASGDLTFKHGDAASEADDDTIDSGGDDEGVIDVSDANANTMGKVVDLINASANWEAWLVGSLRDDASAGELLNRSETTITSATNFLPLYKDTSAALNLGLCIGPVALEVLKGATNGSWVSSTNLQRYRAEISMITHNMTFGSGVNNIQIYDIDPILKVETLIYKYTGAATTVEATKDFENHPIESLAPGHHLLVQIGNGAATSVGEASIIGRAWQFS